MLTWTVTPGETGGIYGFGFLFVFYKFGSASFTFIPFVFCRNLILNVETLI